VLLSLAPPLWAEPCQPQQPLQAARVTRVVDGDTVKLHSGDSVRLIGINAPELGYNGRAGEPLAQAAKQRLAALLAQQREIYLEPGVEQRDRYGRRLAHLFLRRDGGSIEAELLREGYALQVVVPPNVAHRDCLRQAEAEARQGLRGVWAESHFAPRDARRLGGADAGFRRVRLRIDEISANRSGWWLEGGRLALRLSRTDRAAFPACVPDCWRGRTLVVRGWLIDRSGQRAVRERGHPPLLLTLRDPGMVESVQ
jgi:endonuclease YncB( thermonuclease family)